LPLIPIYVDLQSFLGESDSLLLDKVIRQIIEALLQQELLSPERREEYSLTYARDFIKALESILDEAKEKRKDFKLVFMFDEAEVLLQPESQLGEILRAALTVNQDVVAIIATETNLLQKNSINTIDSPFFNIFIQITLQPLNKEFTNALIIEPSIQAGVTYDPNVLERIYELSGGMPYYTQIIGSELISLAKEKSKDRLSVGDLDQVIPRIFDRLIPSFQMFLQQLDKKEIEILKTIASNNSPKEFLKKKIRNLEDRQIIVKENGRYRFVSQLIEEWFNQKTRRMRKKDANP
jgi:hypothetical protein